MAKLRERETEGRPVKRFFLDGVNSALEVGREVLRSLACLIILHRRDKYLYVPFKKSKSKPDAVRALIICIALTQLKLH